MFISRKNCLAIGLSLAAVLSSMPSLALEFSEKPVFATATITDPSIKRSLIAPKEKKVVLMNIKLTPKEEKIFLKHATTPLHANASISSASTLLPATAEFSMEKMPVLNQGQHGTCVTFAVTAAIDALLGKGDYVSQLCSLNLGRYLKLRSYYPSGWSGTNGPNILDQVSRYGVISKANEKNRACGNFNEYPVDDPEEIDIPMSPDAYKAYSESVSSNSSIIYSSSYAGAMDIFLDPSSYDPEKILLKVKTALASKNDESASLIVVGVLLPLTQGGNLSLAKHNEVNDTWVTPNGVTAGNIKVAGGHEMIIYGYDDTATAVDSEGVTHTGLLKLRNSWGSDVGDHGNYYMTYDFFTRFIMEVNKITKVS